MAKIAKPDEASAAKPGKKRASAANAKTAKSAGKHDVQTKVGGASLVVGVGSSAGGLQALKLLMEGLDPASNACFVMAQHVSPAHQSMLAELLAPKTSLPVSYLERPTAPLANRILVVPPNHDVIAKDGKLIPIKGTDARARGARPSIDLMLQTIADEFGDRSVGVVLSGTGSDGAVGASAIKKAGGVVLVQDPKTAQFDSMPMAVIQSRCYDAILPPDQIGVALVRIARAQGTGMDTEAILQSMPEKVLQQIKALVRRRTGFNLAHYKNTTVLRRIQRRTLLASAGSIEEYLAFLSSDADEARRLADDLSVRVTSFFRDPTHFAVLEPAIQKLVANQQPGQVIRVWVPGCASGEEAYSIAILLMEAFRAASKVPSFLMFITDINPASLTMARVGRYSDADIENVPAALRARYFDSNDGISEISKVLRQHLVFASQNVVEDPPFSKLDLVSCRNLLIYFEQAAQEHVINAFHYALKPGGILFLGSSENIEGQRQLFEPIDQKAKLYQRTDHPAVFQFKALAKNEAANAAEKGLPALDAIADVPLRGSKPMARKDAVARARDLVADHYAPPAILVNDEDVILHFMGDLSPFVSLPRGKTNWQAHQLVVPPLNLEMKALLHRCRKERITVRGGSYSIKVGDQVRRVALVAHPDIQGAHVMVFIAFEMRRLEDASFEAEGSSGNLIRELETELANTREHLQSLIEAVESSNEELQTVNEELQSSNEELQSSNEEMQTSNEELQSANEEMMTVNDELASKTAELESARSDLENLKEALDIGIVAVDSALKIEHFNAAFLGYISDGQLQTKVSLATADWSIPSEGIATDTLEVMQSRVAKHRLISHGNNRHLSMGIVPILKASKRDAWGAVLSFTDVTEEVRLKDRQLEQEALYRLMMESSTTGTLLADLEGKIIEVNGAVCEFCNVSREELLGSNCEALFDEGGGADWRSHLKLVLGNSEGRANFDTRLRSHQGEPKWVAVGLSTIVGSAGGPSRLVMQLHDIHQRKRTQERLAAEHLQLQFLNVISRRVLESESLPQLRRMLMADLALIFDGMRVSYLSLYEDLGLVVQCQIGLGGEEIVQAARERVNTTSAYMRRLKALEFGSPTNPKLSQSNPGESEILDLPISDGSQLVGVVRLQAEKPRLWPEDDLSLLRSLADMLSLAQREAGARAQREDAFKSLRQERERVETTLSSISDGVITTNMEGLVETMNPSAQRLCGVVGQKFQGKALFTIYQAVRGERELPVRSVVERCLTEREPIEDVSIDLYLRHPSGSRTPINHSAAPIMDGQGEQLGAVLVFRDVTDTNLLTRELSYRASHDSLTSLPNRAESQRQIEHAIKEAQSGQARHAVIAFDLDHFKFVNDTAGHPAGDALLRMVAKRCRESLRASDTLARTGGDEFLVLLRNCGEERAMQIGQSLVDTVASLGFEWQGRPYQIGASAGVTLLTDEALSVAEILDRADSACYVAKRNGRGRVEISSSDEAQGAMDTASLTMVREAIANERCGFHYQTAVPLQMPASGAYVELLLRLAPASGDATSPDSFITAARRHHLLLPLDQASIRQALKRVSEIHDPAEPRFYGLNLFAESLRDANLPTVILEAANRYGVDASKIVLEIPEQAITNDLEALAQFCALSRRNGFKLAMDQFGSHLVSFSAIRTLQLDFVKFSLRPQDLSLGRPEPIEKEVLEALCHICRRNGTRTIAVGVEHQTVIDELRDVGVDYAQGTGISPEKLTISSSKRKA